MLFTKSDTVWLRFAWREKTLFNANTSFTYLSSSTEIIRERTWSEASSPTLGLEFQRINQVAVIMDPHWGNPDRKQAPFDGLLQRTMGHGSKAAVLPPGLFTRHVTFHQKLSSHQAKLPFKLVDPFLTKQLSAPPVSELQNRNGGLGLGILILAKTSTPPNMLLTLLPKTNDSWAR